MWKRFDKSRLNKTERNYERIKNQIYLKPLKKHNTQMADAVEIEVEVSQQFDKDNLKKL